MANLINIPVGTANIAVAPAPIGTIIYNSFPFQITRIEKWIREPMLDASGVDYCLSHVVLGVRCVFNPFATATATQPVPGAPGDRIGVSLNLLQKLIDQPRKLLQVFIGPDLVLQAPDAASDATSMPPRGDANHGPKVIDFRVLDIPGLKSAVCYFEVECWIAGPAITQQVDNIVLSNRWETTSDVDEDWYTTVTTTGRMRLRTDLLERQASPTVDIFRGSLLPPVLDGFKRVKINIHQTADNREIAWNCIDRQQAVNLGSGSPATRVEGSYTAGVAFPYKDFASWVSNQANVLAVGAATPWYVHMIGAGPMVQAFAGNLPAPKNSFHFRGWAPPGGSRDALARMLLGLALDRFSPQLPAGGFKNLITCYVTAFVHEVAVEVRGEFIGALAGAQSLAVDPGKIQKQMNLSGTMNPDGFSWTGGELPQINPNPPNSGNSRGTYAGLLLAAALKPDFNAPAANLPSYQNAGGDVVFQ